MTTVLDPTDETAIPQRERVARPESLNGLTVGLLDISKPRGNVFLDRVEERLTALGASVNRYAKPTFAKPAPVIDTVLPPKRGPLAGLTARTVGAPK